jgi:phosphatidylserine/phosphatidylglycerophosphate/cardiolipin synthase-like enzyme
MWHNRAICDIYIGKGAGKKLLEEIDRAEEEIQIVSPYLSPFLVKKLIELYHKGISIKLITTDDIEDYDGNFERNLHKLIRQHQTTDFEALKLKRKWEKIKAALSFVMGGIAVLAVMLAIYSEFNHVVWALMTALIAFILHQYFKSKIRNKRIYNYHYSQLFPFRVYYSPKSQENRNIFIHSKIYLIDKKIAYLGSLNFTSSGTKFNHETRIRTTEAEVIRKIEEEVDELFTHPKFAVRDIQKWGKQLYSEPIN